MKYRVEIPYITTVGEAYNLKDLVAILKDGDCVKKMTVTRLCEIIDSLEEDGIYRGYMSEERYPFMIKKVDDWI